MFMSSQRAIADTPATRTDLRLVVLAQWVRAGFELMRGAGTTGRGFVGGVVALWRLAQAVRLAMVLVRRLGEAGGATGAFAPAPTPDPIFPVENTPANAAALREALAEMATAISAALSRALHRRASDRNSEPSGSLLRRANLTARGSTRRSVRRRTPPCGLRPFRPPGPERPPWRSSRSPHALRRTPPPIAALAIGRLPLGRSGA
jgi:hypothetical protein